MGQDADTQKCIFDLTETETGYAYTPADMDCTVKLPCKTQSPPPLTGHCYKWTQARRPQTVRPRDRRVPQALQQALGATAYGS
eukprot:6480225-Amphidinium_carterae.1